MFQTLGIVKPHADYEWRINLVPVVHLRTQSCYSAGTELHQNKNTRQHNKIRKRNNLIAEEKTKLFLLGEIIIYIKIQENI